MERSAGEKDRVGHNAASGHGRESIISFHEGAYRDTKPICLLTAKAVSLLFRDPLVVFPLCVLSQKLAAYLGLPAATMCVDK